MKKKVSFGERFRYAFDNVMSRGTGALIFWLVVITVIFVALVSGVLFLIRLAPGMGFDALVWKVLNMTIDPGTITGEDLGNWPYLLAMLGVTVAGIVLLSTLIGIVTTGIDTRLAALRKGRSRVIERNHTVILGWSEQVFATISEIVEANANQPRSSIVVLADKDKVEMEDEIRTKIPRTGRTKIICRTGTPIDTDDLRIARLETSRSVIILSPEHREPDSEVIKTILAITNNPDRRAEPYHIVAEIRDPRNLEVARMVAKDEAELLLASDLVARITAQTCRQTGLSVVYGELLDFEGDEIYFHRESEITGKTFGQALFCYESSAVIGIVPEDGEPKLNPAKDYVIKEGDQLIVIAEDDDTTKLSDISDYGIDAGAVAEGEPCQETPEKILILGWNWRAANIICQLDNYVPPTSSVLVVADTDKAGAVIESECRDLKNLEIAFRKGETTSRRLLDELDMGDFDHVVILCYSDKLSTQEADAETLITLLHLRDIAEKKGHTFSIVSEMLDERNRNLAEVTRVDDFIVSDKIISQMLSQVSENKALNKVFEEIFDPEGAEIYLKPASDYVKLGREVNFYTVIESARKRGEVAFGYKLGRFTNDAAKMYGVVVNPEKSEKITYAGDDRVIVLAED
ncbi:potassium transporter TrkA [candidate division WOR-3 bacterium]|uniref:Potassium transporter TrkA n=1 Tax=candidate division WOR-3 bacterium TaxID=2052148 RepID=A0A9D5QC31_UNCW3|nr:potassium transporter TrkA [candidate division WOR-3 bacterium]MBD3364243.1 potassium transporter TrkA [candidate division WOR-3 bacterium]